MLKIAFQMSLYPEIEINGARLSNGFRGRNMMIIKQIAIGYMDNFCYIVGCENTRQALVIDPGSDADRIVSEAEKDSLEIVTIVNTHGHGDHTAGNATLKERTGARVFIHELDGDRYPDADVLLCNEKPLQLGDLAFDVIHTPGHTPGGICLHASKISSTYLFRSLPAAALKIVRIA